MVNDHSTGSLLLRLCDHGLGNLYRSLLNCGGGSGSLLSELAELLVSEWVNTRIDLSISACERLAHDWNNLLFARNRVRDHLLFKGRLRSSTGRCRRNLLCAKLTKILVLALHSLVLDILIEDCATIFVLHDDALFSLSQGSS